MATLKAHGHEIGTIYSTTGARRYMSDGAILEYRVDGWKLHAKVKPGLDPRTVYENAKQRAAAYIAARPALAAYRKELHELAGNSKRWKLHAAIELMPNDPDGVWSEACDSYGDNAHADIDEVSELCRLYLAAYEEAKRLKPTQQTEGQSAPA